MNYFKLKQEYTTFPVTVNDVVGESSRTIFLFMKGAIRSNLCGEFCDHPYDVDDFERNRSLLLQYPEWRKRLPEMRYLNKGWEILIEKWDEIEII